MQGQLLSPPALRNVEQLLATAGECYYVPAYQRQFAWDKKDVERFFESIIQGICSWSDAKGVAEGTLSETFMGAIVCFDDCPTFRSIYPKVPNDFPAKVHTLVDGQQRLTICLATAIALHHNLSKVLLSTMDELKDGCNDDGHQKAEIFREHLVKCKDRVQETLLDMLTSKARSGDQQYYPRMIRQYVDKWSTERAESQYESPVSNLLSTYKDHVDKGTDKEFKPDSENILSQIYKKIHDNINWIAISNFASNGNPSIGKSDSSLDPLPEIAELLNSMAVQIELLEENSDEASGFNIFEHIENIAKNSPEDEKNGISKIADAYKIAYNLLVFSSYFLRRVKFVQITTTGEDYAFSIFDSLNTTGAPLTAFETYISAVKMDFITRNSEAEYKNSKIRMMIDEIEKILSYSKRSKNDKTKRLIVSFALAERGDKLTAGLNEQRRYMLNIYKGSKKQVSALNQSSGYQSLENLLHVARVHQAYDNVKERVTFNDCLSFIDPNGDYFDMKYDDKHKKLASEAKFCLRFLATTKHRIVIPLISRFYSEFANPPKPNMTRHKKLCEVIRSAAAFFVLWRAARDDTKNIDNHHRKIMLNKSNEAPNLNFARQSSDGEMNVKALRNEFCRLLVTADQRLVKASNDKHVLLSKDGWKEQAKKIPIYSRQSEVAVFIHLLSSYYKISASNPSFYMSDEIWLDKAHESIEHIAPQKYKDAPPEDDPRVSDYLDCIGNLTLLPQGVNSYIGGAEWKTRRLIYSVLCETDDEQLKLTIEQLKLSDAKVESLMERKQKLASIYNGLYLPGIKKIASYEKFGSEEIQVQSGYVLGSVWDTLIMWLGTDKYIKPQ